VGSRWLLSDEARLVRMIMLGTGNSRAFPRVRKLHLRGVVKTAKRHPTIKDNVSTEVLSLSS
jgi:hypothetical protein